MGLVNFDIAYKITKGNEGFYDNDPKDPGGETILGLTRFAEPESGVWAIADVYRDKPGFPDNMRDDVRLYEAAQATYRAKYWTPMGCDHLESQVIANEIFDAGVNLGILTVGKYLQISLNSLNKEGALFPNLLVDGNVGAKTIEAMTKVLAQKRGEEVFYNALDGWQRVYYQIAKAAFKDLVDFLSVNPPKETRESFTWGWYMNRCGDYSAAVKRAGV